MTKSAVSIALCRVSTSEQAKLGHSLERQEQNVIKASENLGAPIVRTWSLDQSSRAGKNFKRKDLNEMVAFCEANNNVKYLIVDEVDRFMRDIKYFYYFEAVFEQLGVVVYYASQPELNDNNMIAKLNKLFLIFRAEASNDERMSKSVNGLKERVRLGYYPFPVPQGYKKTSTPGLFEPCEPAFSLLQQGFRMILSGKNQADTVRWLTNAGYLSSQGKQLYPNRFREMLRCSYYAGAIRIAGWDFTNERALHKPMVTLEEFEQIQNILDGKRHKNPHKNYNPEIPLSNLMECTECGGKLVGFLHRNTKKTWSSYEYRCRGCKKKAYKRDNAHAALDTVLLNMCFSNIDKPAFIAKLKDVWVKEQSEAMGQIQLFEARKEGLKVEKKKYLDALASYPHLKDGFLEQIEEVDKQLKSINEEILNIKKIDEDLVEFTSFALHYVENLKENWWNLDYQGMRKCKQILFPAGFSINSEEIVYTPQISPLFRFEGTKKSPLGAQNFDMVEVARVALASNTDVSGVLHV